uniref:Protein kinase domain-containing protein n=1 Tax=Oryza punctata TaxID=4537 RepID=A0A0E0MMC0_ORYPU
MTLSIKKFWTCISSVVCYDFIFNGSLDHHLHVDGLVSLSWDDQVRVALVVARSLVYLHLATIAAIFYRDNKASNIVLDDNLTTKISDFGASRYIPIDQTGVTTDVQGTIGYLDPMYYYTGHLTNKSDDFSFGILLIELLTENSLSIGLINVMFLILVLFHILPSY